MTTSLPLPDSPVESTLGTKPVAIIWIHPESGYTYIGTAALDRPDAAAALRSLANDLDPVHRAPSGPAGVVTEDFAAVMASIHDAAVTSPVTVGETEDYQRGWDEAMTAVASIAGTYEPEFAYRADEEDTGPVDIEASDIASMHRNGFRVSRRAVGPWETVPKGARN